MSAAANPALMPPAGLAAPVAPSAPSRVPGAPPRVAAGAPAGAGPTTGVGGGRTTSTAGGPASGPSFAELLAQAGSPAADGSEGVRFSRHALQRVQRRGIDVGPATLARLSDGVARAAGKGSRDSLVLVDSTAFVVAVPSRTVVTAVGAQHMREHVFTNVDSAVIA